MQSDNCKTKLVNSRTSKKKRVKSLIASLKIVYLDVDLYALHKTKFRMKKIAISILTLSLVFGAKAQSENEMIENGSFEQLEGKIKKAGAIDVAVEWMSPTKTAADLFATKVKTGFGVPNNPYGREEAHEGENYAGITTFSYGDKVPRTYLSTKLKTPMRKGMKYAVKFYVCLSEGSKYAANNVAANFSKKQWSINENKSIIGESSVLDVENVIFNAMFGWDQVCGVYTAKGGEKFLTLGNFSSNADTKNERMKKPKGFTGKQVVSSYYYIDDISVTLIDDESECKCESDKAEVASTVYSSAPVNPEGMTPEMVAKFSVIYFASNKGTIEAGQEGHLDNIADIMLSNPAYKLTLKIHLDTDEVANPKALGLDKIRGESVKKYLKTKGIDGGRITFNLMKDTQPKSKGVTDLSKAKNRRVKFVLSK